MKKFRTIVSLILILSIVIIPTAFAESNQSYDIVKEKQELAKKYESNYNKALSKEQKDKRSTEIELMLNQISSGEISEDEVEKELENMQIYKLNQPKEAQNVSILSDGGDVQINAVTIYLDSVTNRWHVTGGGWWKNNNWGPDAPSFLCPSVNDEKNVGQRDMVGIAFFNTSGSAPTQISGMGYWTNQSGWNGSSTSQNHGDSSTGIGFEFQDKVRVISTHGICQYYITYLGIGFSSTITYDSDFANFNGNAKTMYSHTWSNTYINSVNFNLSTSPGAVVTMTNGPDGWTIFNNSDTSF